MSDTQWYYADRQRQRQGPLPTARLRDLLAQGEVDVDTLVWHRGLSQWQPLQAVADQLAPSDALPDADPAVTPDPLAAPGTPADPYAAPASSMGAAAPVAQDPAVPDNLRAYAAFVGKNFEVYRRKWGLDQGADGAGTWNWPAFLFGAVWMAYRRMYGVAALWAGALTISSIIETVVGFSDSLSMVITLGASVAAGASGNLLYLRHTQRMIAKVSPTHAAGGETALHADLAARGGTRWAAVAVFLLIYVVVIGAVAFLFEP